MSCTTDKLGNLPTEAQYEETERALGDASSGMETLLFQLRPITRAINSGAEYRATYEDMGQLYACVIGLRLILKEIDGHVGELAEMLDSLDHARVGWKEAA